MRQLADNRKTVEKWRSMEKRLADIAELISLAEAEKDTALAAEVQSEVNHADAEQLEDMEFELAFSGQYDATECDSLYPCRSRRHRITGLG